jgi:phosphatidylinositol-3-phosphatase
VIGLLRSLAEAVKAWSAGRFLGPNRREWSIPIGDSQFPRCRTRLRRLPPLRPFWLAGVLVGVVPLASCSNGSGTHTARPPAAQSRSGAAPTSVAATTLAGSSTTARATSRDGVPRFSHIVLAVLENHSYGQIIGAPDAPFLNMLAASGVVLTQSYAVTHPSEPNYLVLFSGSTQGLSDDSCPHTYTGPNLAAALIQGGYTFTGYSQSLPSVGFTGCNSGGYARKHNPWVDFPALPRSINQPMTAFPADFAALPSVSFVIPDLDNDMHNGSVSQGDQWLRTHLGAYAEWAGSHNSLLIVTADEDDNGHHNRIPTLLAGAHLRPVESATRVDHYSLLRTLLASFGIPPFGDAASSSPITGVWLG